MRYQNWDVLLFADTSRIPIQEFKTGCHVVQDPESAQLQAPVRGGRGPNFPPEHIVPIPLPTVASFVPGLAAGTNFNISIHSWERASPSAMIRRLAKAPDIVIFEARVMLDGICVSWASFPASGPWPQIIDWTSAYDKNGDAAPLRFPPFHDEILKQNWWNAGENLGRVKIVIAEGFSRPSRIPPFERVRNIVSFAFQHAPLNILETCGIAWPNPEMWRQVPTKPFHVPGSNRPHGNPQEFEVHCHNMANVAHKDVISPPLPYSPQGHGQLAAAPFFSTGRFSGPRREPDMTSSFWTSTDPFQSSNRARSSTTSSHSTAAGRSVAVSRPLCNNERANSVEALRDEHFEHAIDLSSPTAHGRSNFFAPANPRRRTKASTPVPSRPAPAPVPRPRPVTKMVPRTALFRATQATQMARDGQQQKQKENAPPKEVIKPVTPNRKKPTDQVARSGDNASPTRPATSECASRAKTQAIRKASISTITAAKRKRSQTMGEKPVQAPGSKDTLFPNSPIRKAPRNGVENQSPVKNPAATSTVRVG